MKITNLLTYLTIVGTLVIGTAISSFAQAPGARGGAGAILTQDQRTKMREAMQASQSELTQLTEKLAAAEKEAVKAALAKDADEKSVRPKIEAVSKIQTEIAVLRLKAVKEIASTLTDEQKTQLDQAPGMGYNVLLGSFGGRGAGGARRGNRGAGAGTN